MTIVADTNTFLAVTLREPEKDALTAMVAGHNLLAPRVLPFELGNALSAMVKKGSLEKSDVRRTWDMLLRIPVELCDIDIRSALDIAARFNLYAYDAYFLECALKHRAPLLTLDKGMQRVAKKLPVEVLEFPA